MNAEPLSSDSRQPETPRPPVPIAGWQFDVTAQSLRKGDQVIGLSYRAAQVLWRLHAQRGESVSRAELIAFAWPGQLPTDMALSQVIVELRRAIGDSARQPRHLLTVPRVGYRLVAATAVATPAATEQPDSPAAVATGGWHRPGWRLTGMLGVLLVIAMVLATRWSTQGEEPAPSRNADASLLALPNSPVPVAFSGASERMPDLSPDGSMLAYSITRERYLELQVRELRSGRVTTVTSGAQDIWPRFSRDGRLAFLRRLPDANLVELRVIDRFGGEARRVAEAALAGSIDWTPDGREVVAGLREQSGQVRPWAFDVERGTQRPLLAELWAADESWIGEPAFSPSGKQLLLRSGRHPFSRLLLIDLATAQRRDIDVDARTVASYAWDADTHLLLSAQARGRSALWRVEIDTGAWQHLRNEPLSRITAAAGRLVFPRRAANFEIMRFTLAGAAPEYVERSSFDSYFPRFAGGPETVLWLSDRSGSEQFWLQHDAQAANPLLTLQDATVLGFDVSADGRRVMWSQENARGAALLSLAVDGQTPERIDDGSFVRLGAVALHQPTGAVLFLGSRADGPNGLFRAARDGQVDLLVGGEDFEGLQTSPGGQIVVARRQPAGYFRFDPASGQLQPMVEVASDALARWRVTDEGIAHVGLVGPEGPAELRMHPFDGGPSRRLRDWPVALLPQAFDLRADTVVATTVESVDVNLMLWEFALPDRAGTSDR